MLQLCHYRLSLGISSCAPETWITRILFSRKVAVEFVCAAQREIVV